MPKVAKIGFFFICSVFLSACTIGGQKSSALQVSAKPEASVFLDGKHLGKTPYYSDQIKPGEHILKIASQDAQFVDKITLLESSLTVVNRDLNQNLILQSGETLWLEDGKSDVFLNSSPQDAEVTIQGKFKGNTPILIGDLENGDHKVEITKPGYKTREFSIKTSSKYRLVGNVTLAAEINTSSKSEIDSNQKKVEILKTPQGFLRVRKEPDLTSQEVGQVKTQDQLEVIQETDTWIKISFEGKLGWISKQYTKSI